MQAVALLRLQQIFDSQFPVGAFAHSGGIEAYAQLEGFGPEALEELLLTQIRLGWGRLDLAAAALSYRAGRNCRSTASANRAPPAMAGSGASIVAGAGPWHSCHGSVRNGRACSLGAEEKREWDALAAEVEAWKPVPGQRLAGERVGRRMQILAKRLFPAEIGDLDVQPPQAPVVAGAIARRLGLEEKVFLLFYAHSNLMASLAAATRSMALSPERAHQILVALQPSVAAQVERVFVEPMQSLYAATPGIDLRAHEQAFLHTRLFQS
jgi:urease accessory protein